MVSENHYIAFAKNLRFWTSGTLQQQQKKTTWHFCRVFTFSLSWEFLCTSSRRSEHLWIQRALFLHLAPSFSPLFFCTFQFLPLFSVFLQNMRKTCLPTLLCSLDLPWDTKCSSDYFPTRSEGTQALMRARQLWTTPGSHHGLLRLQAPHVENMLLIKPCSQSPPAALPQAGLCLHPSWLLQLWTWPPAVSRSQPELVTTAQLLELAAPSARAAVKTRWDHTQEAAFSHTMSHGHEPRQPHVPVGEDLTTPHS